MSTLARFATAFRDGDKAKMHTAWKELDKQLDLLTTQTGYSALTAVTSSSEQVGTKPMPPLGAFRAAGSKGVFTVQIANPQQVQALSPAIGKLQRAAGSNVSAVPILHNLQSATSTSFDASSGLKDYGVSTQSQYSIPIPSTTLFFRVRHSYDGVNWTSWQLYPSSVASGS